MKSSYDLMLTSNQRDAITNDFYLDVLSSGVENFRFLESPLEHVLTSADIDRFDRLMFTLYGSSDYEDIILQINNVISIFDLEPGQTLRFPTKTNLEGFYQRNLK